MKETTLFNHICEFVSERRTPSEGEQRTYIIMELAETEDNISMGLFIIDPAAPPHVKGEDLLDLSLARHTAYDAKRPIMKLMDKLVDGTNALRKAAKLIGIDKIIAALGESDTPDQFRENLLKHGVSPALFEANIKTH